jgi:hypothetical protein
MKSASSSSNPSAPARTRTCSSSSPRRSSTLETDETRNVLLSTAILQQITPELVERLARYGTA